MSGVAVQAVIFMDLWARIHPSSDNAVILMFLFHMDKCFWGFITSCTAS